MSEDKKKVPHNTTLEAQQNPIGVIAEAMIFGSSQAIERQEAQGQKSLVQSQTLPSKMDAEDRLVLEKAGVKFGKKVERDEMFQYVELPAGWKKVATGHSMWSKLVDDKGRERAEIFYKAAFYDREAFLRTICRYSCTYDYDRAEKEQVGVAQVTDGGKVIHTLEPLPISNRNKSYDVSQEAYKRAKAWLDAHYPDWKDTSAYWD